MKRLFFTVALAACFFSFPAFASHSILPDALHSFYKTFKNAENVSWTEVDDMLRVGFTLHGRQQYAYYLNDELVVVATEIKPEDLPTQLKSQLSKYNAYTILHVYVLDKNNDKEYCVVMDSGAKRITLKGKAAWQVYLQQKD